MGKAELTEDDYTTSAEDDFPEFQMGELVDEEVDEEVAHGDA
jgi:hypothetical protein